MILGRCATHVSPFGQRLTMRSNAQAWLILTVLCFAIPVSAADIVAVGGETTRITVLDAADVAAEYVRDEGGRPMLRLPNGEAWELIGSTDDPEIANPGDGSFHPIDPAEVVAAVRAIDGALTSGIDVTVYILPLPRRGLLDSSASDGAIYLSPGVRVAAAAQIHMLVTHEFGHVFHRRFLPDSDASGWSEYRELRGIADESVYSASAEHKNRPREIFAEDFRYLFGGALANVSGSIENAALALPDAVPGLEDWMSALAVAPLPMPFAVSNFPDPFASTTTIRWTMPAGAETASSTLRVFDASGRLVRAFDAEGGAVRAITWDGRDGAGRRVAAGVYFALLEAGSQRISEPVRVVR